MDKKPLIGVSIIAVVLLVLGSLTNVVGYQQVQSTAVNDSPLFSVRAKRAIKQTNGETLTSDYLGRGIESNFQFPIRENRTERLQKCVDIIKKMDDKEFSKFQSLVVSRFYEDKNNKNINSIHVLSLLKQIRSNTKELPIKQLEFYGIKLGPCTFASAGGCDYTLGLLRFCPIWKILFLIECIWFFFLTVMCWLPTLGICLS